MVDLIPISLELETYYTRWQAVNEYGDLKQLMKHETYRLYQVDLFDGQRELIGEKSHDKDGE